MTISDMVVSADRRMTIAPAHINAWFANPGNAELVIGPLNLSMGSTASTVEFEIPVNFRERCGRIAVCRNPTP
jgi:hypothetical protein